MQDSFNLPKIELHAHIYGCVRPTTFMELALNKGADLDKVDFYNVNIATAFEFFKIVNSLITDLQTLKRVVCEIIEDFSK
jgi:adenosine deaminase